DSRSVFFLRSVGSGAQAGQELFQKPIDGDAVQRSRLGPGPYAEWQLARDGTFFMVLRSEPQPEAPGAGSDVIYVNEGSNGQTRDTWMNVWRYELATGALTRLTDRDWTFLGADLSPDGRTAVVSARPDNERNTRARTELFTVDMKTGAVRQLTRNGAPELGPLWSPDGRAVLFSAVRLDRWEWGNGDLWLLDVASGQARNLTPGHPGRFGQPVFSPDGASVFVQSGWGTTRFPVQIDVASGRITPLSDTEGVMRVASWSADRRRYAYVYTDFQTPPDVYVARVGARGDRQQRLTDLNAWVRDEIALGSAQRVQWPSFDGRAIEGLLLLPAEAPRGRRPLIVHVPCGPGCAWLNAFSAKQHVWAGLGYAQLSVNVRGASNYDDAHMLATKFDIGGGDRRDIEAGVDAMIERGIADPDRLAIDGWSYGGVLGGYALTKTTRFKAASLGAMVSDFISEYGAVVYYDRQLWFLGGTPWTDPEQWRGRSALTYADRVRTPTLLHHGAEDTTCSPAQSR
ncbi:MAG TPA: prolyl oligopeptidase family serine peptidase, partial [Vicinamibacteria bacterium]|nr:prolyl oligopeptidase family serine peptidase [Vicinamibacteria bacterium]